MPYQFFYRKSLFWATILTVVLLIYYLSVYKLIPVSYYDEPLWIGRGYLFDLLIHKDFYNPIWQTDDGFDQPILMEIIYGMELYPDYLQYKKVPENNKKDFLMYLIDHNLYDASLLKDVPVLSRYRAYQSQKNDYIHWNFAIEGNKKDYVSIFGDGFQKTFDKIILARRINVVLLLLATLVLYKFALYYFSPTLSFFIAGMFGFNTLVVSSGLRAHSEALFLLFFILGMYLLIAHFNARMFNVKMSIVNGIVIGLCTTTKLNGLMLFGFYIILAGDRFFRQIALKNSKDGYKYLFSIFLVALIVFNIVMICNPFTYVNPVQNVRRLYSQRWENAVIQRNGYPNDALTTFDSRVQSIFLSFFGFERSDTFNTIYPLRNVVPNGIAGATGLAVFIIGTLTFMSNTGSVVITSKYARKLFITLFIGTIIAMMSYLQLNWERYYVPASVFVLWFEAIGVYVCVRGIVSGIRRGIKFIMRHTHKKL